MHDTASKTLGSQEPLTQGFANWHSSTGGKMKTKYEVSNCYKG